MEDHCNLDKDCVHFNPEQQCMYALSCRDSYIFSLETALMFSGKHDDKSIGEFREYLNEMKRKI